jgi:hypothetical protein
VLNSVSWRISVFVLRKKNSIGKNERGKRKNERGKEYYNNGCNYIASSATRIFSSTPIGNLCKEKDQ